MAHPDVPVDDLLEGAKGKLEQVIVAGYDRDGVLYFGSSVSDGGEILWLLKMMEKALLDFWDNK